MEYILVTERQQQGWDGSAGERFRTCYVEVRLHLVERGIMHLRWTASSYGASGCGHLWNHILRVQVILERRSVG